MTQLPDPLSLIGIMVVLALVPFIAVMATSFVKISVVMSLLRNALGVQQIPPNMAVHGLAIILTIYIMAPVAYKTIAVVEKHDFNLKNKAQFKESVSAAVGPYAEFLKEHSSDRQRDFFLSHAKENWPDEHKKDLEEDNLLVLLPAFALTELTSAFEIGFLLYLPFVAIDLIISNILLAMGMMMVSPMTISLPLKILLFVLLDGWTKLIEGLVMSY